MRGRRPTIACTRPDSAWMPFARSDACAIVCGRVMRGVGRLLVLLGGGKNVFRKQLIFVSILLGLSLSDYTLAKEWHGIIPMYSNRADVERLLGKPNDGTYYDYEDERVQISYVEKPCESTGHYPASMSRLVQFQKSGCFTKKRGVSPTCTLMKQNS